MATGNRQAFITGYLRLRTIIFQINLSSNLSVAGKELYVHILHLAIGMATHASKTDEMN
jgi:hypothetical protein